ncbi:GAF domain-containing protein, partial [bacterium]|nr:GAF domain-containing protein [bacterium]
TDLAQALKQTKAGDFFTISVAGDNGSHTEAATSVTLQQHPWKVVFLQEQTNLVEARDSQNRLSTVIATIIAGIVGLLIIFASNLFTRPIFQLTQAAEKISAGDLNTEAIVRSKDEIGILGNVFNKMTHDLKVFIDTLETRVQERTEQLAKQNDALTFRSAQLQTVSDVARNIVSNRDLETLLTSVTTLINERFNFYHVGIFLIDAKGEFAVLRAANSAGGRKMLERQHKLQVGQTGIVGYVTLNGEPRIATDVGKDAVFFNNPDLPNTRSEMALPLKEGNRIIGALDVQSVEPNAFTTEDIELFSTLADQIAIAISNNQLYENTRVALDEAQNLHRRYLNQEWTRKTREPGNTSYKFTPEGLVPYKEELPDINTVLETARPIFRSTTKKSNHSSQQSVLAVPILLRG